jgi:hypothetical protein
MGETGSDLMKDDPTPINARPKRQRPEALEDLSLALRDRLVWPLEDRFVTLSERGRAAVVVGAVALALAVGVGGYSLVSSDVSDPQAPAPVAVVEPAPQPVTPAPQPEPAPDPTLQGATPVFKAPHGKAKSAKVAGSKAVANDAPVAATTSNTGNAATDTISSNPTASPTGATASTSTVDGPPAGPAAIAVARKFAGAFVVYETGGNKKEVREAFAATATPELTDALMQRPPRQPAGVEVPKAKVLNVVPAPSHDRIYPISVSLLRVGSTSELRLEMEQLKNKQWRVVNVLG